MAASRASWITLGVVTLAAAAGIAAVHRMQVLERERLHQVSDARVVGTIRGLRGRASSKENAGRGC